MAKTAPRMTSIALRNGTDILELETAVARRSNCFSIAQFFTERGDAAAVVIKQCTKQCTKSRPLTMYLKICALVALIQIFAGSAFAVDDKRQPAGQPGGILQGTPEEQAACAPDSTKFCRDAIPDAFRVLACLQEHRNRLRKVCLKVLEDHGQ
jgi:hypothetical protein